MGPGTLEATVVHLRYLSYSYHGYLFVGPVNGIPCQNCRSTVPCPSTIEAIQRHTKALNRGFWDCVTGYLELLASHNPILRMAMTDTDKHL